MTFQSVPGTSRPSLRCRCSTVRGPTFRNRPCPACRDVPVRYGPSVEIRTLPALTNDASTLPTATDRTLPACTDRACTHLDPPLPTLPAVPVRFMHRPTLPAVPVRSRMCRCVPGLAQTCLPCRCETLQTRPGVALSRLPVRSVPSQTSLRSALRCLPSRARPYPACVARPLRSSTVPTVIGRAKRGRTKQCLPLLTKPRPSWTQQAQSIPRL